MGGTILVSCPLLKAWEESTCITVVSVHDVIT